MLLIIPSAVMSSSHDLAVLSYISPHHILDTPG